LASSNAQAKQKILTSNSLFGEQKKQKLLGTDDGLLFTYTLLSGTTTKSYEVVSFIILEKNTQLL
jgi:hypothetical protein